MRFSADALVTAAGEHLGALGQTALRDSLQALPAALSDVQAGTAILTMLARQINAIAGALPLACVYLQVGGGTADLALEDIGRHPLLKGHVWPDASEAIGAALWSGACFGSVSFGAPTVSAFTMEAAETSAASAVLDLRFQTSAGEATALCVYGLPRSGTCGLKTSVTITGQALALMGAISALARDSDAAEPVTPGARPAIH